MFYHVEVETHNDAYLVPNQTRDQALSEFACPYISREITLYRGGMFNMAHFANLTVYQTERPVDSDWPVAKAKWDALAVEGKKSEELIAKILSEDTSLRNSFYEADVRSALAKVATDVTSETFAEAVLLIESGHYKDMRRRLAEARLSTHSFFICPVGVADVDHNYTFVIKPAVERHQYSIARADDISHTGHITDVILDRLSNARFVIADLTDARPNCYYELGYAHALRKPVIIIAREGTARHFDISTYKWNYWKTYKDLKPTIEKEIAAVLQQ